VVVVDDASTDPATRATLDELAAQGVRVLRHQVNRGPAEARMTGLEATTAPYAFPLDADDLAVPGIFSAMADRLDAEPSAAICLGDYEEFGDHESIVAVPEKLDAFRLAYTQEYGPSLFRRDVLEAVGGWRQPGHQGPAYEDWHLLMSLAEGGHGSVHMGPGVVIFRRRLHGERMLKSARQAHRRLYRDLRRAHPDLFRDVRAHRRASSLPRRRKWLYPFVYGRRPRFAFERRVRFWLDRRGIWTLRRRSDVTRAG
jgi:glycosyltransferase involved in cell wall biosynthesis